jgi:hypothetical protein
LELTTKGSGIAPRWRDIATEIRFRTTAGSLQPVTAARDSYWWLPRY